MMRRFHSYGPVNQEDHFCVSRKELVQSCLKQLIGKPEKGGHYFTIWAPRQTGKTWLMEQVIHEIKTHYPEQFDVFRCSLGVLRGLIFDVQATRIIDFPEEFSNLLEMDFPGKPKVSHWTEFRQLFSRQNGLWKKPVIVLIDEVDTAPSTFLDLLVNQFRELYLNRETNWLHGLALIGVHAVLGIGSRRGSPFNVQRSLHVPNFSYEEVEDLFRQYQEESGQKIEPAIVNLVYEKTRGQPGLVCWFGELLTEKYNPGKEQILGKKTWQKVWLSAKNLEPNNTVMNLIAKAKEEEYQVFLAELFSQAEIEFLFHDPIHNYLYLNGIIAPETNTMPDGREYTICRFTSPFVQECLFQALSRQLTRPVDHVALVNPLDDLSDVLDGDALNLPALLDRYRGYLGLLKSKGINPWKEQPRRKQDYHITEAVGHFHLYHWLQTVLKYRCVISPEFPTGNGKVDLHIKYQEKRGIIEVKSFVDVYQLNLAKQQAAEYALQLGLDSVTMALFVPFTDESLLRQLTSRDVIEGVVVSVSPIGWI